MQVRVLLDEDTEKPLASKLSTAGHDVERVVDVPALGAGSDDTEILKYAAATERIILTYDDDYLTFEKDSHAGLFFLTNQRLSSHRLFTIIQTVLDRYPSREQLPQVIFISDNLV